MPSNFEEVGKSLQTTIPVPDLPIASIHHRLRDVNARHRSNALIACTLAVIAVLGSGTVLASMALGGARIWLSGDKAALAMHSFTYLRNPNADELRRVTTDATFPVVLPMGIPKGMHMDTLLYSPADHPNFIEVLYRNAQTDARSGQFILFDSSIVDHGETPPLPDGEKLNVGEVTRWNVGQENVIMTGAGQPAKMKAAMSGITPSQSLAQTSSTLYRITVLAGQDKLADAAQTIAPLQGRSVLVDGDGLAAIARLAQSRKPLLVFRGTTFDAIPIANGKLDFAHQKSRRITETAVSADGVRALAAVLAMRPCACEMLINERNGRAVWVWALPLDPSTPPTKYVVDPTTFRVARGV